ncbi:hypothetical protein A1O1_00710 [Capronia coronata CBS 617.96]|uniref:Uncharacterized protein n=1 Tax=Capronia coronata CBS 617.96 TaxID=1182541 RepID=W9YSS4_9EURO|nr:uncharacterized protein A1O1_00710 [Capronia coronata CBS 617.96]EXJ95588.1 hypothetical protein A1O1_00710 [Capronia coronata CBS 617.96]
MASSTATPFRLRYVDRVLNFQYETMVAPNPKFLYFLGVLTDLSIRAAQTTTSFPFDTQGLNLSDGPWQYRITRSATQKTAWRILRTHADFEGMLIVLADAHATDCLEVQHSSRRVNTPPRAAKKKQKKMTPAPAMPPAMSPAMPAETPPEAPSQFAIWEQYRWPPVIVDSGIIHEALREERLEGIYFGKAPKVEPMDLDRPRE